MEEARAAHKTCYDEFVQCEEAVRALRLAHAEATDKQEETLRRLAQLADANAALDEQLAATQERHRTCVKELQTREVAVTKLRVDLDAADAKCRALVEEVASRLLFSFSLCSIAIAVLLLL